MLFEGSSEFKGRKTILSRSKKDPAKLLSFKISLVRRILEAFDALDWIALM